MKSFWTYYFGIVAKPRSTIISLLTDSRRLRHGSAAILIATLLYSIVILILAVVLSSMTLGSWSIPMAESKILDSDWKMDSGSP